MTLLSEIALTTRSAPTISTTKLWRAGLSKALTQPRAKMRASTIAGVTAPRAVSAQSVSAGRTSERLRDREQTALGDAVGEQAAPHAREEHRQELQAGGDADERAVAGQLQDQPHLGDGLHPVAAERDDLAGEVAPVVRDGERAEGAAQGGRHRRPSSSSRRSRMAAARSSVATSSGVEGGEAPGEELVLARALAAQQRAPAGAHGDRATSGGRSGPARGRRARAPRGGASTRVAVGRWTRSCAASSLGVSGPWRSIAASAEICDGLRSAPASWRSRRAVRDDDEPQVAGDLVDRWRPRS